MVSEMRQLNDQHMKMLLKWASFMGRISQKIPYVQIKIWYILVVFGNMWPGPNAIKTGQLCGKITHVKHQNYCLHIASKLKQKLFDIFSLL